MEGGAECLRQLGRQAVVEPGEPPRPLPLRDAEEQGDGAGRYAGACVKALLERAKQVTTASVTPTR
jgi:hypothetical protein